ncbi:MAG TPA: hypothetical protein VGM56_14760, partial [Byssovorax sp.]
RIAARAFGPKSAWTMTREMSNPRERTPEHRTPRGAASVGVCSSESCESSRSSVRVAAAEDVRNELQRIEVP